MSKAEELNELLTSSFEQLVECTNLIKEIPLEPKSENIYRLGKALAEISDVMGELYKIYPQLKPEKWGKQLVEEDYFEIFGDAVTWADEYIQANQPEKAIEVFEQFIFITPYENLGDIAKDKITEIKHEFAL